MVYLVTGGAGFIGTNYCLYFLDIKFHKDDILVVVDKLSYASNDVIKEKANNKNLFFIKEDITHIRKMDEIFKRFTPDFVINFAAETHVDTSIKKPDIFIKNNVEGLLNLLKLSVKYKIKRFHQVSTDEVYGDTPLSSSYRFKEIDSLHPSNPYSVSKASGDLLTLAFARTYRLDVTISRCSNNYGRYQYKEKLIPLAIGKATNNENIPVYGNGNNIRDWINVKDHVRAIDFIVEKGNKGEIYNVSTHNELSNLEVVEKILKELRKPTTLIKFVKDRKGHDKRYALDTTKLEDLLSKNLDDERASYLFKELQNKEKELSFVNF